jgi:tRNA dimethylallyltransferase
MQVYRGMDIGTAKASAVMRREVPHHLIDLVEPEEDLPVAVFQKIGRDALDDIAGRHLTAVICGGSGLHFRSLIDPLEFPPSDPEVRRAIEALGDASARGRLERIDPEAAEHVDMANPRRVVRALEIAEITGLTPSARSATKEAEAVRRYQSVRDVVIIGVDPGDELAARVERRFDEMLRQGLLDEVASLQDRMGRLARQAVGYKELLPVVAGRHSLSEGRAAAISATRALAKRQRTFFRRDPRINWITWDPNPKRRLDRAYTVLEEMA